MKVQDLVAPVGKSGEPPKHFVEPKVVYRLEWCAVRKRRKQANVEDATANSPPQGLVGLALSGGGIRSATFSLGVLQALGDLHLLRIFDYMSTVSGGGFAGGWWSAWLARHENKELFPPHESLEATRDREHARKEGKGETVAEGSKYAGVDPVHHLRLFSNYLTPRKGLLSGDFWRAAAVISRNVVLTWLVMVPLLLIVVLFGKAMFLLQGSGIVGVFLTCDNSTAAELRERLYFASVPIAALIGAMVIVSAAWLVLQREKGKIVSFIGLLVVVVLVACFLDRARLLGSVDGGRKLLVGAILGAGLSVASVLMVLLGPGKADETRRNRTISAHATLMVAQLLLLALLAVAGFGHELVAYVLYGSFYTYVEAWVAKAGGAMAVICGVAGAVVTALKAAPTGGGDTARSDSDSTVTRIAFAVTPSLMLLLLALGCSWVGNALVNMLYVKTPPRSPHCATLLGTVLCLLLAGFELKEDSEREKQPWRRNFGRVLPVTATIVVVGTVNSWVALPLWWAVGVAVVLIVLLFWLGAQLHQTASGTVRAWWLLLFVNTAMLLHVVFSIFGVEGVGAWAYALSAVVATAVVLVIALGWTADPNVLSLHTFYKARLVRAYLGASNTARRGKGAQITQAVDGDNLSLSNVRTWKKGGPYHIMNATLNLVGGNDLAISQRSAAPFTLAPIHCGSLRTGYVLTKRYMSDAMTLGTAMAVSGAAASPNMGARSPSAATAMLMTLLNVRLGYWAPTPNRRDWRDAQARLWPFYVLREFLSQTTALASYCYLTDGGHFDNTGLYSLVERGCRHIVLVDCGADPRPCFEDLGDAVRRCRIDFGATIEIDIAPLRPNADPARHFAVGRIIFSEAHVRDLGWPATDEASRTGRLIVLKPHHAPCEPVDVIQYRLLNDAFPQQRTADQWFDEAQFESYRHLGEHTVWSLFGELKATGEFKPGQHVTRKQVEALFDEAFTWTPTSPAGDACC